MIWLILGLVVFLGTHSLRIVADDWRTNQIARLGELPWKGLYAAISVIGLGLTIWGYAQAQQTPVILWVPPSSLRHVTALFTLLAFILLVSTYVPGTRLKATVSHPMLLGTFLWAFGHLLSNGSLAASVLFGSFLVWSAIDFAAAQQRGLVRAPVLGLSRDITAIIVGSLAWWGFAHFGHLRLIGVSPF